MGEGADYKCTTSVFKEPLGPMAVSSGGPSELGFSGARIHVIIIVHYDPPLITIQSYLQCRIKAIENCMNAVLTTTSLPSQFNHSLHCVDAMIDCLLKCSTAYL